MTPVTIVTQTRVSEAASEAFGRFQARISAAVAAWPGFLDQSVLPPKPPLQTDWVVLQRFDNADAATGWLHAPARAALLAEILPPSPASTMFISCATRAQASYRRPSPSSPPPACAPAPRLPSTGGSTRWPQPRPARRASRATASKRLFSASRTITSPSSASTASGPCNTGIVLLGELVPHVTRLFAWWLNPDPARSRAREAAGVATIAGVYAVCLALFSRL